jgi:hypothetical protein
MVEKYMNEWDGCNLREFCFSEKVNIYRMLKTMKKMECRIRILKPSTYYYKKTEKFGVFKY